MRIKNFLSLALVLVLSGALFVQEVQAKRFGGGGSLGRQSLNIGRSPSNVAPATPVMRNTPANSTASTTASATKPSASATSRANAPARSGLSRFLGPIAGIAAGIGISALLASLGLSGAVLDFMSSLVLVLIVFYAIKFVLGRLRKEPQTIGGGFRTSSHESAKPLYPAETDGRISDRNSLDETAHGEAAHSPVAFSDLPSSETSQGNWFIPADFNTSAFLQEAKKQFVFIQSLWDKGDLQQLKQYMTDDLAKELTPQILAQSGHTQTEVLLLNAELLGMEKIQDSGFDGHLASVRFSGMIREEANQSAFRFEEVWNLYKTEQSGWLLAGIQQIPVQD